MPFYDYKCDQCGHTAEGFNRIAERNTHAPHCINRLHGQMRIKISSRVIPDLEPYYDDNLQTHIKSRQHRKEVMREQGVSEAYGKGWT